MRIFLSLLLLLNTAFTWAQDDDVGELPPEQEMALEEMEDEYEDEEDEPRTPPAPTDRFRTPSKRFNRSSGNKRSFGRRGGSGGGEDRLGKTEGQISFDLVQPPKYYKKKNKPYLKPSSESKR